LLEAEYEQQKKFLRNRDQVIARQKAANKRRESE
jgi:hypothetical protein